MQAWQPAPLELPTGPSEQTYVASAVEPSNSVQQADVFQKIVPEVEKSVLQIAGCMADGNPPPPARSVARGGTWLPLSAENTSAVCAPPAPLPNFSLRGQSRWPTATRHFHPPSSCILIFPCNHTLSPSLIQFNFIPVPLHLQHQSLKSPLFLPDSHFFASERHCPAPSTDPKPSARFCGTLAPSPVSRTASFNRRRRADLNETDI